MKLQRSFFERATGDVAADLLGKVLNIRKENGIYAARIIETGAYRGEPTRHGRSIYVEGLWYDPGKIYIATYQGGNRMLLIGTESHKEPAAVTIRSVVEPSHIRKSISQVCKELNITNKRVKYEPVWGDCIWIEEYSAEDHVEQMEGKAENCEGYYILKL